MSRLLLCLIWKDQTLHFNGKAVREAVIDKLLSEHGMDTADIVVVAGSSAGALGVFLGIDQMAAQIRAANPAAVVVGVAESGFFMPHTSDGYRVPLEHDATRFRPDASIGGVLDFKNGIKNVFTFANMSAGTNARCLASYAAGDSSAPAASRHLDPSNLTSSEGKILPHAAAADCVFPVNVAKFLKTPIFVLQVQQVDGFEYYTTTIIPHGDMSIGSSNNAIILWV